MIISSVGIIGVGNMGMPIARHLLSSGYRVAVYDIQEERVAPLVNKGARPDRSPKEVAADCELTLVVVLDDLQVKEVCMGSEGILKGALPNAVVAICSTVQPQTCREVGDMARVRQIHVLDTPMVRGVQGAVEGKLLLMVGGDPQVLDQCRPVFSTFASDIYHLGDLGSGQVGKIVNNLILRACLTASCEGVILAKSQGVDLGCLREALINGSADNYALRRWDRLAHQPEWLYQKDLAAVLRLSEESQTPVPISALVKAVIKDFSPKKARELLRPPLSRPQNSAIPADSKN